MMLLIYGEIAYLISQILFPITVRATILIAPIRFVRGSESELGTVVEGC